LSVGVTAEIKSKLDIVELIGEQVVLKKAGQSYKGLCPFHSEKTPSFTVTPARESWKCFGCGRGGDIFNFVMERDSVTFPEALQRLAARAGVELDERTSREDARRKRLREALESAITFYHQVLTGSRHGQAALDYLHGRGLTDETIASFQLGFAPDAWDELSKRLIEKRGFRPDELETVGLAVRGRRRTPDSAGVYDRFRGRVIFPIRDASGGAIGMGGRVLVEREGADGRDQGPKYLNSPATPLFDKSRALYLIDRAKGPLRKEKQAVIVEGYTDALAAHQAGFTNVVASLGTALTPGQVELVTRYAPAIALAYDVDAAGQSAGSFGAVELSALIGEVQRSGAPIGLTDVSVVRLPEGKDPDEVIREDPETWRTAVATGQPVMEYLIDLYAERHDPRTVDGRKRFVSAVMPALRRVADPVERDAYLQLLARRSGVEERVLLEVLHRSTGRAVGPGARRGDAGSGDHAGAKLSVDAILAARGGVDPERILASISAVEQTLLRLLLLYPEQQVRIASRLDLTDLPTTPARELWKAIVAERASPDGTFVRERYLERLDAELRAIVIALLARREPVELDGQLAAQAVDQCLLRLERERVDEQVDHLRAELADAEARGDAETRRSLLEATRSRETERADIDRRLYERSLLSRAPATSVAASATAPPEPITT
jgi:DNA primase